MRFKILLATTLCGLAIAGQALAWGDTGHRLVGEEAMKALPKGLPVFLYAPQSALDVGQFSREPDVWRKSGSVHDAERDPAHLMRLDDDGMSLAGTALTAMPATRSDYEAAVRAHGGDPLKAGYLYYSLIDAYEQVRKDFAVLRVIEMAQKGETDAGKRAWLKEALRRRQDVTLRDIGILSHYAGDATQPMHVSIHYDGWGDFPNPEGFTPSGIHWAVEGPYVRERVTQAMVRADMLAQQPCATTPEACTAARLLRDHEQVLPLYTLEKSGAFKGDDVRGPVYLAKLLGQGASDLRDMIADAWTESTAIPINFNGFTPDDVAAGKVKDVYNQLAGDS